MVEKAQEKVAGLQTLTVELGRQLEEEREERENLVATWDQEMADLQAQVSSRHREHTVSVCRTLQVVVELHQLHSLQRLKCQPFSPQSVSLIERFFFYCVFYSECPLSAVPLHCFMPALSVSHFLSIVQ